MTTDRVTKRREEAREMLHKLRFPDPEPDPVVEESTSGENVGDREDDEGSSVTIKVPPAGSHHTNGGVKV
jgi:hypothetical protein